MGTYISIIILNVNRLVHQPIWTDQMDTKTRPIYMLPTGDPLQYSGLENSMHRGAWQQMMAWKDVKYHQPLERFKFSQ